MAYANRLPWFWDGVSFFSWFWHLSGFSRLGLVVGNWQSPRFFNELSSTGNLYRIQHIHCPAEVTFAGRRTSISFDDGSFGPSVGTRTPHCVARVQFSGAHVAPFQAPPLNTFDATGTELSWLGVAYFFFNDETPRKIQALWVMGDVATIYAQLSATTSTKSVWTT